MPKKPKSTVKVSPNNDLRCIAHEIIIILLKAKDRTAINLLRMHCDKALKTLPDPL